MTLLRLYPFLIPLVVLLLCEITKVVSEGLVTGNWKDGLFRSGGMPSTHSAFVTSLLIVVGRLEGVHTTVFAVAFCFACITWYDAMNSRRAIGVQAHLLNRLQKWQKLSERVGHSFAEVVGGILFGTGVTVAGMWIVS